MGYFLYLVVQLGKVKMDCLTFIHERSIQTQTRTQKPASEDPYFRVLSPSTGNREDAMTLKFLNYAWKQKRNDCLYPK